MKNTLLKKMKEKLKNVVKLKYYQIFWLFRKHALLWYCVSVLTKLIVSNKAIVQPWLLLEFFQVYARKVIWKTNKKFVFYEE